MRRNLFTMRNDIDTIIRDVSNYSIIKSGTINNIIITENSKITNDDIYIHISYFKTCVVSIYVVCHDFTLDDDVTRFVINFDLHLDHGRDFSFNGINNTIKELFSKIYEVLDYCLANNDRCRDELKNGIPTKHNNLLNISEILSVDKDSIENYEMVISGNYRYLEAI